MSTQAFHAAHQCGDGPCIQRLCAGRVRFRGTVADKARDSLDREAGAFDVVERGKGNQAVLRVGVDQPRILGEGVGW